MLEPLDALGTSWTLTDEVAEPGYYAATLSLGHPLRGHRRARSRGPPLHLPEPTDDARIVIDFSLGGLAIPHGATVPLRAHLETLEPGVAQAEIVVEGVPLAVHLECDAARLAPAALVRPAAHARRHPARLRPDPTDDPAARSA